jgi:hypothetical protein
MEQHDNQHQVNRSCLGLIENFIVLKAQGVHNQITGGQQ